MTTPTQTSTTTRAIVRWGPASRQQGWHWRVTDKRGTVREYRTNSAGRGLFMLLTGPQVPLELRSWRQIEGTAQFSLPDQLEQALGLLAQRGIAPDATVPHELTLTLAQLAHAERYA